MFFDKLFKPSVKQAQIDYKNIPAHIAIIMDGNGRWAKKRGLSRNFGHREGAKTLKKITEFCSSLGVRHLTVYAFSTENWKRPKSEVDALMTLLLGYLKNAEKELVGKNTRINVIGDVRGLPDEIQRQIVHVKKVLENNKGMSLNIALNYGSRQEILAAVKTIAAATACGKSKVDDIDEAMVSNNLYTSDIPDPDLLIRTSGEQRISNFLLWQAAYTEFWYTDVLWPDFRSTHILEAIQTYQKRNRRYGGV